MNAAETIETIEKDMGEVDPMLLRRAFGSFATGITIVTTTDADGQPVGLTANSFTSVSLDPPLVLFCLDRNSSNLERFQRSSAFGINVLSSDQQELSSRFVKRGEDRFHGISWELRATGVPVIEGAAATFECVTHTTFDGGDHLVFVGRVRRFDFDAERNPLLYFQGRYRQIADLHA
ncbi:flavin reductase family protein [Polaromonas sp.]|uniref:flavin reductase family protein n=1 Tax=Polaromonas sp. TaxID=1869339 RepID=UPI001DAB12AD|nr:flavin reductase family protein [Polaromonas sp.]MBT9475220.1 flavin reductase family protein [Polaromonas sp.]